MICGLIVMCSHTPQSPKCAAQPGGEHTAPKSNTKLGAFSVSSTADSSQVLGVSTGSADFRQVRGGPSEGLPHTGVDEDVESKTGSVVDNKANLYSPRQAKARGVPTPAGLLRKGEGGTGMGQLAACRLARLSTLPYRYINDVAAWEDDEGGGMRISLVGEDGEGYVLGKA